MILYLLIILLILYVSCVYFRREGFKDTATTTEFKTFINENIYDTFYSHLYDDVIHTIPYETEVIKMLSPYFNSNPNVLCVGSKTGHIVQLLSETTEVTGIDNSKAMIELSKKKYPKNKYVYGEYTDNRIFQENTFTMIMCPLFTIYRVDLAKFLDCTYRWVVHKGIVAIVFVKEGFNISQIQNLDPTNYFKLNYKHSITMENNTIIEKLTTTAGDVRTNKLYLNDITELKTIATDTGFKIINTYDIPNTQNMGLLLLQKN
jgi:ubiquinone/menaquinone biosynthesis C-methylase UbiE